MWYQVDLKGHTGLSYHYPTFTSADVDPTFCTLENIEPVLASSPMPELPTPPTADSVDLFLNNQPPLPLSLHTFHVGQGMCSLLDDGVNGVLFDIGAGKPVIRRTYPTIKNELVGSIAGLQSLNIILSHADEDHWRILQWDSSIRAKVRHIFVPSGSRSLSFQDRSIRGTIRSSGGFVHQLAGNGILSVTKAQPVQVDNNGICLISTIALPGVTTLLPGDYTYDRFITDINPAVRQLHSNSYDSIVVPHHGDARSSLNVPAPGTTRSRIPIAFFSAGTHQGYHHPTNVSLTAHTKAGYQNISNPTETNIVAVRLW
jgi:beta-lactamase superfamily II metal-dependent hydrolase